MSSRFADSPKKIRSDRPSGAEIILSVRNLRDVPTLSITLQEVLAELNEKKSSLERLTQLVRRDQVLAAKVLRTVNSAYFARTNPIADLKKALHFLGEQTLRAIVVGCHCFKAEDLLLAPSFDVLDFWKYCFAVGVASEQLGAEAGLARGSELFTAGLLHDMGKLVHLRLDRETFAASVEQAAISGSSFLSAEQELGLPGHAVLSEVLGESWNLPPVVRKLGRYYHRDVTQMPSLREELKPQMIAATLAIGLVRSSGIGQWGDQKVFEVPESYATFLALKPDAMKRVTDIALEKSELMSAIFKRSVLKAA